MTPKQQVAALARKMFGKNAIIEERPKALDAQGRAAAIERRKSITSKISELETIARQEPALRATVLKAAQFVCDVDGDDPSIADLKKEMQAHRLALSAIEERRDLEKERRDLNTYTKRYNVSEFDRCGPLPISIHCADGDTWEELLANLKKKALVNA